MPKVLSATEAELAADLLQKAADHFGDRVCNDYNLSEVVPIVQKRRELMKKFHEWNGDPENFDPNSEYVWVSDFMMMAYMAFVIGRP